MDTVTTFVPFLESRALHHAVYRVRAPATAVMETAVMVRVHEKLDKLELESELSCIISGAMPQWNAGTAATTEASIAPAQRLSMALGEGGAARGAAPPGQRSIAFRPSRAPTLNELNFVNSTLLMNEHPGSLHCIRPTLETRACVRPADDSRSVTLGLATPPLTAQGSAAAGADIHFRHRDVRYLPPAGALVPFQAPGERPERQTGNYGAHEHLELVFGDEAAQLAER
jgi:hypothetical protein